jgi:hypothetical protein
MAADLMLDAYNEATRTALAANEGLRFAHSALRKAEETATKAEEARLAMVALLKERAGDQ